jgi:long-subunit fatty acid transport protein
MIHGFQCNGSSCGSQILRFTGLQVDLFVHTHKNECGLDYVGIIFGGCCMRLKRVIPVVLSSVILCLGIAEAQSPVFSWASPRSMALGGVSATGFDQPSNMHLNPASLVEIERFTLSSGLALTMMDGEVNPDGHTSSRTQNEIMPAPHITAGFNFGARLISAGISLNTFDTYRVRFPSNAGTRYQGTDMMLYSGGIDLGIGFMPIQNWAFGLKLGLLSSYGKWERSINPFPSNPEPEFDMRWKLRMHSFSDVSFLAGVQWSPTYRFKTGLTWRPQMRYEFNPKVSLELPDIMGSAVISSDAGRLRITIPQEIRMGMHWIASERIDVYVDVGWTEYSRITTRAVTAKDPKSPYIPEETLIPVNLNDVWHGHIGIEYLVSGFLTLRAGGFYYTESVRPDYEISLIPQESRYGYTAGVGLNFFAWLMDIAVGKAEYDSGRISGGELPFPLQADTEYSQYFAAVSLTWSF